MAQGTVTRRRRKIGVTVDPTLVDPLDKWLRTHPAYDRSKVIDEALRLWWAREQQRAMKAMYAAPNGVPADEWADWKIVRDAAAIRQLTKPRLDE